MIDPMTSEQLAKYIIREWLERAEKERLAAEVSRSNGRFLNRLGAFVLNWMRRPKSTSPQKPIRYSPATRRS
jgi:hypothetical protein